MNNKLLNLVFNDTLNLHDNANKLQKNSIDLKISTPLLPLHIESMTLWRISVYVLKSLFATSSYIKIRVLIHVHILYNESRTITTICLPSQIYQIVLQLQWFKKVSVYIPSDLVNSMTIAKIIGPKFLHCLDQSHELLSWLLLWKAVGQMKVLDIE